jgi:hypothetical protein
MVPVEGPGWTRYSPDHSPILAPASENRDCADDAETAGYCVGGVRLLS